MDGWYGVRARTAGVAPSTASWTAAESGPCPAAPALVGGAASDAPTAPRPYRAKIRSGKPNQRYKIPYGLHGICDDVVHLQHDQSYMGCIQLLVSYWMSL